MKTKLKIAAVILIGVALIFGITQACKKKGNNVESICQSHADGTTKIDLQVKEFSNSIEVKYYLGENSTGPSIEVGISSLGHNDFSQLASLFNDFNLDNGQIIAVVPYFVGNYETITKVSNDLINGYSIYIYQENNLIHKGLLKFGDKLLVLNEYTLPVKDILAQNLLFLAKNFISSSSSPTTAFLLLIDRETGIPENVKSRNSLSLKQFSIERKIAQTLKEQGGGGSTCHCQSPPCPDSENNSECVFDSQRYEWWCRACCTMQTESSIIQSIDTITPDTLYQAYDYDLAYAFRDSVMVDYEKGQQYIDYYCAIGRFLGDNIPVSLCVETAWMLFYHNSDLENLIDTTGHSSDIILDSTFSANLQGLLEEYRDLSSDSTYVAMINEMIGDVSYYSGMTIFEILTDLSQ